MKPEIVSMNDNNELSRRWKELAEQLGLPPEDEAEAKSAEPQGRPEVKSAEPQGKKEEDSPSESAELSVVSAETSLVRPASLDERSEEEVSLESRPSLEPIPEEPTLMAEGNGRDPTEKSVPPDLSSQETPVPARERAPQEEGRKPRRRGRRSGKGSRSRETDENKEFGEARRKQRIDLPAAQEGRDAQAVQEEKKTNYLCQHRKKRTTRLSPQSPDLRPPLSRNWKAILKTSRIGTSLPGKT